VPTAVSIDVTPPSDADPCVALWRPCGCLVIWACEPLSAETAQSVEDYERDYRVTAEHMTVAKFRERILGKPLRCSLHSPYQGHTKQEMLGL
jgi:hypothetical protein